MTSNISIEGLKEAMTCGVCLDVYDQARKTPLSLPCGHTFCRPCLVTLKASRRVQCPTCRKQHEFQVGALPVNYPLLNLTPLYGDLQSEECTTHGDNLRYFCSTCGQHLCSLCIHAGHPQSHRVKRTEVFVQEEKVRLEESLKGVYRTLEGEKEKLKDDFNKLDTCITEFFLRRGNLTNVAGDLDDLLAKVQKAKDIATIKHLEKAVRNFRPAARVMSPSDDKSTAGIMGDSGKHAANMTQKKAPLGQQQQPSASSPRQRETTNVPGPVLDYRDDHWLLHSFPEPKSTELSPQVSLKVFLELSVGDRPLGRVYITLWSHMRLAQQFLALCMGTAEQSLKGKKAYRKVRGILEFRFGGHEDDITQSMIFAGESTEQLWRLKNFSNNTSPLNQPNLEWGGKYAKPEVEGIIMRTDANDGLAFGICTKTQHGVTAQAPFGMVVDGLDVARLAFLQHHVTAITVTDCGLVLPPESSELVFVLVLIIIVLFIVLLFWRR